MPSIHPLCPKSLFNWNSIRKLGYIVLIKDVQMIDYGNYIMTIYCVIVVIFWLMAEYLSIGPFYTIFKLPSAKLFIVCDVIIIFLSI